MPGATKLKTSEFAVGDYREHAIRRGGRLIAARQIHKNSLGGKINVAEESDGSRRRICRLDDGAANS